MAAKLRLLASHGMQPRYYHKLVGINSRLDTIQAAILNVKIAHLQVYSDARQKNANRYAEMFAASGLNQCIELPFHAPEALHVWNQYGIRVPGGMRDSLRKHLSELGIGNEVGTRRRGMVEETEERVNEGCDQSRSHVDRTGWRKANG